MKTYRAAIQIQIEALQQIYNNSKSLRDLASYSDEPLFNKAISNLPIIWDCLQKVDNRIIDEEAAQKTKGNYSIAVNYDSI